MGTVTQEEAIRRAFEAASAIESLHPVEAKDAATVIGGGVLAAIFAFVLVALLSIGMVWLLTAAARVIVVVAEHAWGIV